VRFPFLEGLQVGLDFFPQVKGSLAQLAIRKRPKRSRMLIDLRHNRPEPSHIAFSLATE
jgi:hypothetical protein